jgi:hypothetical protein
MEKAMQKMVANSQDQITNEIHELREAQKQHMKAGEEPTAEQKVLVEMLHRYGFARQAQKPR